jgi:hypothetical protein
MKIVISATPPRNQRHWLGGAFHRLQAGACISPSDVAQFRHRSAILVSFGTAAAKVKPFQGFRLRMTPKSFACNMLRASEGTSR